MGPPCILRWSQVCPIVGHCVPLVRADQASGRTLCDSSGLENKAKQGRRTDVRFLGGSRREREGFTLISESNRRRMERLYNDRRLDLHIIIRYRLTVNARRIDSIDHGMRTAVHAVYTQALQSSVIVGATCAERTLDCGLRYEPRYHAR